jgi:TolB protein
LTSARVIRTVLIAALTLLSLPAVAEGAFPGQNGKIAFDRYDPGAQTVCIYIANADGSGQAPLLPCDSRSESTPRWSPDGSQIAYEGDALQLDLINADGSNLRPFFFESGISDISGHGWSPDGARLVVSWSFCGGGDGVCEGEIENIDAGTGAYFTILSAFPDKFFSDTDWSPDGSVIAFTRYAGTAAGRQLYVIHPDGTGLTPLAAGSPGEGFLPSWAPSGDKIAFVTGRDGNQEIYVMNADGTGQTRLTTNAAIDTHPAWSPDGTKILFQSWRDGNGEIYVMNADGSVQTNLTNGPAHESRPDWQPIPGPRRSDYKNGSHFCKAEREFLGADAFAERYGDGANAHGRCVSGKSG